jgi:hypothetical protein
MSNRVRGLEALTLQFQSQRLNFHICTKLIGGWGARGSNYPLTRWGRTESGLCANNRIKSTHGQYRIHL